MAKKRERGKGGAGDDARRPASRDRKPFLLRLPPDVMEELRGWASQELRSLNAHIEYLLREALRRRKKGA